MNKHIKGFRFSKLVVIQSLTSHEVPTGRILGEFISTLDSFVEKNLSFEIQNCLTKDSLVHLLRTYIQEAKESGSYPILHFECHGMAYGEGLALANDENITWPELALLLIDLNVACAFNLFVFFAACDAAYFIEEMNANKPSPVYSIVAPSDKVNPSKLMRAGRIYYSELFSTTNADQALRALKREKLECGQWFGLTAEQWFEEVVTGYVKDYCSAEAITERARCLYQEQKRNGGGASVGSIKRALSRKHSSFVDEYFQKCFFTHDIPKNTERFSDLKRRVERQAKAVLSQPRYKL